MGVTVHTFQTNDDRKIRYELVIDEAAIIKSGLGARALKSKVGKATAMRGAIKLTAEPIRDNK